ncbi:glycosyl hydrolase-related protein [Paenibacillus sp. FSL L8-0708]|uniref:glycosyl hydrolase-related protein n=1 Tax=Paenibacillus sp. FSL L8-0708 TaxID=2975311 RepID=UPI0030FADEAD
MADDKDGNNGVYPSAIADGRKLHQGDDWTGSDVYLWLQRKVLVPAAWQGKRVVGLFDFGRTGGGNNSGFESLLFLDSKPYQGGDSNHQEVFLEADAAGSGKSLITSDAPNIAIDAIKLAEDGSGWIVRLHEYTGTRCSVTLSIDYSVASWQAYDLMERPLEAEAVAGPAIRLDFKHYEINTFRITLG